MASGGKRTRSGPAMNPDSSRSQRRKISLQDLPAAGFTGRVPAYPFAIFRFGRQLDGWFEEDAPRTKAFRKRELEVWRELWRTPQACAWALKENAWRRRLIALYCRLSVRCEYPDASPSLMNQLRGLGHEIGMTQIGLIEQGWKIESSAAAGPVPSSAKAEKKPPSARERGGLTLVANSGGA